MLSLLKRCEVLIEIFSCPSEFSEELEIANNLLRTKFKNFPSLS